MMEVVKMFSSMYFKQIVKSNIKSFAIFTVILCGLITIIMGIFNPEMIANINASSSDLPFNPLGDMSTLINFIANQYYGMMALILPMIYLIFMGNKLIAAQIDKGSMAYNLATPTTRNQITGTSAIFLILSLTLMFIFISITGIVVAEIVQPGELDISTFLLVTAGAYLLQFAISGIVFFASCVFNFSSKSLMLGAGLSVFFFAINLLVNMSSDLEFLKVVSLFELFDASAIIAGEEFLLQWITLFGIGALLYIGGMLFFKRKDLPL